MLKVLLKKQLSEIFRGYFYDQRKNKARSKGATAALLALFLFGVVCVFGGMFTSLAQSLCGPLVEAGTDWLYFVVIGFLAAFIGLFGSVFSTYSALYLARDNDLLLSMPIPIRLILLSRLLGVYLMGLLFSAVAAVPAVVVYRMRVPLTVSGIAASVVWVLLLSFCVLALSCALGWCVAKFSQKMKNKSYATVLLSLLFLGLYYTAYFKAQSWISLLAQNAAQYGEAIRARAAILYGLGLAGQGNWIALLCVAAVLGAVCVLIYRLLSRSFLQIAAASASVPKTRYREKSVRSKSVSRALLDREFVRFTSNPNYMLNCGFGILLLLVGGVLLLLRGDRLSMLMSAVPSVRPDALPVLLCAAVCLLASGNDMTAPSVSLEGKTLWLLRSLPVTPWQTLRAKLSMQLLLTGVPALFCCVCTLRVLSVLQTALLTLNVLLFACLMAAAGLYIGVKRANLQWTNEIVPIKQSAAVFLAMFGGWLYAALLGGAYMALSAYVGSMVYLAASAAVTAVLFALTYRGLRTKGCAWFAEL